MPWELLYADDLVLITDSLRGAEEKFRKWREGMASKGLRGNINKTKVLHSGPDRRTVVKTGAYPCAVCGKEVGINLIQCTVVCVNVGFTMGRNVALKLKVLCQRRLLTLKDLCV